MRLSAGEAINRIRAERAAPQASILYGIGLPSMLTLKADGLLETYKSPESSAIPDKYKDADGYWTGTDVDFIGFASNKKFLQEKGIKAPQSWEDLTRPEFAGQICLGSPSTSGTGYTVPHHGAATHGRTKRVGLRKALQRQCRAIHALRHSARHSSSAAEKSESVFCSRTIFWASIDKGFPDRDVAAGRGHRI